MSDRYGKCALNGTTMATTEDGLAAQEMRLRDDDEDEGDEEEAELEAGEDCFDPARDKIWQQNAALCRNFDELKHLYIQSTQVNLHLQATCAALQQEKGELQKTYCKSAKSPKEHPRKTSYFILNRQTSHDLPTEEVDQQQLNDLPHIGLDQLTVTQTEDCVRISNVGEGTAGASQIPNLVPCLATKGPAQEKRVADLEAENRELLHKLEAAKQVTDKASPPQQASELKRKHLDEGLCLACEASNRNVAPDRDAVIFDLEQAMQQLEEHLHNSERKRSAEKKVLELDVERLQEALLQKEKQEQITKALHAEEIALRLTEALQKARHEEERQREIKAAFENEVADLRALLTALEQSSAEAELRHLNAVNEFIKEKERLQEVVATSQNNRGVLDESLLKVKTELSEVRGQMEELRTKLNEAVNQKHESHLQAMHYKSARDELERKMESMTREMAHFRLSHAHELEEVQRNCDALRRKEENGSKERRNCLHHKINQLRKKLKHSQKQVARLTIDCNELLIHKQECEAQLAVLQNAKQLKMQSQLQSFSGIEPFSKAKAMNSELSQLATRQAKYLGCAAGTLLG